MELERLGRAVNPQKADSCSLHSPAEKQEQMGQSSPTLPTF
jgi:hypothetical protein